MLPQSISFYIGLYQIIVKKQRMSTHTISFLEINISFLQRMQEPEDSIVLGFLCAGLYGRAFQFFMNHLLNELSQILLLLLAEKGTADCLRPIPLRDGRKDVPSVSLHWIVKVQAQVHPSEISHFRNAPTSAHKAVQNLWRSGLRHPAGKADTGRKRAGRGF